MGTAQIRTAVASDVPRLLPLIEQYWRFEGIVGFEATLVAAQCTRLLSMAQLGCGWIAEVDGTAVGYLLAVYVFSLEHLGLTAEIDEFFVTPAARAQGVGTRLLHAAEALFVQKGCTNVSLQLARVNDPGREFYRRHAYRDRSGYELLDKSLAADQTNTVESIAGLVR
jgi:GNAT superfamily N-acetyltransferase